MKLSAVLKLSNGHVQLTREILQTLGVGTNSVLHCVQIDNEEKSPSLVYSPIPSENWGSVHKLIVNTACKPGSWAAVCRILTDERISILFAFASATSADGELTITAFVALKGKGANLEELEDQILQKAMQVKAASTADMFSDKNDSRLRAVRIWPLRVLNRFGAEKGNPVPLKNSRLDLRHLIDRVEAGPEYDGVAVRSVLVTVDSEERFMQLIFLPPLLLYLCRIRFHVRSKSGNFVGLLEAVLDSLKELRLNVYQSRTNVESRGQSTPGSQFVANVTYSFTLDISRAEGRGDRQKLRNRLDVLLGENFERAAKALNARVVRVGVEEFHPIRSSLPMAFLATNAKPESDEKDRKIVGDVIIMLRELGFEPVNVDVATDGFLTEQARSLLNCCPLLVSVYLAEHKYRTLPDRRRKTKGSQFAPSPWVAYEEAYATANPVEVEDKIDKSVKKGKKGGNMPRKAKKIPRSVIRMSDDRVLAPEFLLGNMVHTFDRGNTLDVKKCIGRVRSRILRRVHTDDWRDLVTACSALESDVDEGLLRERDIYEWLFPTTKDSDGHEDCNEPGGL